MQRIAKLFAVLAAFLFIGNAVNAQALTSNTVSVPLSLSVGESISVTGPASGTFVYVPGALTSQLSTPLVFTTNWNIASNHSSITGYLYFSGPPALSDGNGNNIGPGNVQAQYTSTPSIGGGTAPSGWQTCNQFGFNQGNQILNGNNYSCGADAFQILTPSGGLGNDVNSVQLQITGANNLNATTYAGVINYAVAVY